MEDRRKHDPKQDEILREVGSVMRTVNELMTIVTRIERKEDKILAILSQNPAVPDAVKINQIVLGEKTMSITGTNAGGSSTFEADAIKSGLAFPAGFPAGSVDTWTTDDPLAVVGPDSGPDVNEAGALDQVTVSIPASDAAASYNLTVSVQLPAGADGTVPAPLTQTVNVPIIQAPPPVPDGVTINQI
jgi:hypothetical protein